jgi:mono/diheme cytochrome c family protein
MTANTLVVRNLAGVFAAIAAVTVIGLWLGRHDPLPAYEPGPALPRTKAPSPERGAALFAAKGCASCHTTDGSPRIGPSFAKRWGRAVTLADGTEVVFDDAYVRESVLSPRAKAQAGYPPTMPSFEGLLKDREIADLAAYFKTL